MTAKLGYPTLLSFQQVTARCGHKPPSLFLGNGFSMAWDRTIFSYDALLEDADFGDETDVTREVFAALDTPDFESVARTLQQTGILASILEPEGQLSERCDTLGKRILDVLINTISKRHPALPSEITEGQYRACRDFLSQFKKIYTLNYDLLLYWVFMHFMDEKGLALKLDDGFRHPENDHSYVVWSSWKQQTLYYLHGALHLFDRETELEKYTWSNKQISLVDQIRSALQDGRMPLTVSDGTSGQKWEKIRHVDYLAKGFRSLSETPGDLVVFGHSFDPNDEHVINAIEEGRFERVFVGVFGDLHEPKNVSLVARATQMLANREQSHRRTSLTVEFYDSSTANPWGASTT